MSWRYIVSAAVLAGIAGSFALIDLRMPESMMINDAAAQSSAGDRLHVAVESYDLAGVRSALAAGAPVDAEGFGGATPALIAAQISAWDICLFLLESGADPAAESEFGVTIPKALAQSRVAPGTLHYEAMQKVEALLRSKGLVN